MDQFNGTRTIASGMEVSSNAITIDPGDKSSMTASGGVTDLSWRDAALDGTSQITYSASSSGSLTATGLSSSTPYAVATTTGTIVDTGTTSASGEITFSVGTATNEDLVLLEPSAPIISSLSPNGTEFNSENVDASFDVSDEDFATDAGDEVEVDVYLDGSFHSTRNITSNATINDTFTGLNDGSHEWYVVANDSYGESTTSGTATFTVNHYAPVINESSASPTGGQPTLNPDLEVDISDRDFAVNEDSVDAVFTLNGNQVGTDTLTTNRTVVVQNVSAQAGTNNWSVVATDSYGNSDSASFTFSSPSGLNIYNETSPTEKLTNVNATVEFYFKSEQPDLIVERNATNGTLDMTGLPVDESFVVVANADGYFNRRIFVESLFETQSIYMLSENESAVQPTFRLIDFTGNYQRDDTVLQIQRAINGSWQTVEGDYFGGANQVTAQLAFNERHRLVILNTETGVRRNLGVYTPTSSSFVELEVTSDETVIGNRYMPIVTVSPNIGSLPAQNGVTINSTVEETGIEVDEHRVHILTNGTTLYNQTFQGAGSSDTSIDLEGLEGDQVTVWVNWTTIDGASEQIETNYRIREVGNGHALLPVLQSADMGGDTPNTMSSLMVIVLALFATAIASTKMGSGPSGLMGTTVVAGGALIGWIPFSWLVAGVVTWLVLSGVTNRI